MKVAVTGASGFIGRPLCAALERAGHEVIPVDLRNSDLVGDVVVHLAAIAHRDASAEELETTNIKLAMRVGQAVASRGARMVFLSSVKVHGDASVEPFNESSPLAPQDAYGESKARAEEALRAIPGLKLLVLRPPLVYGPGVKANFLSLMAAVARGVPLPFAAIRNRRSLVYVGNLVDAVERALTSSGTFLLSDGAPCSTPELCRALAAALTRAPRMFPFPPSLLPRKLAGSLELDDSAIRSRLGWRAPFSFEEGLHATARWYLGR